MTGSGIPVRLLVCGAVLLGLVLCGLGLFKIVHFEPTRAAIRDARVGNVLIVLGCALLLGCAIAVFGIGPRWAAVPVAVPAVVCGGLAMAAGGTLLPQIAAVFTFPLAMVGAVGVLVHQGH